MAGGRGEQHANNIMSALSAARQPLGAYDLLDRLRPTGVAAPITIYRVLEKLIAAGKVHRIESLNAFVACRNGEHRCDLDGVSTPGRSVAFTICDRCGTADELLDTEFFSKLYREVGRKQFRPRASVIEIHGVCETCAAV